MGTATCGGEAGDSGDINGCTFPPEHGQAWAGGNGGQYGGGGGSGYVCCLLQYLHISSQLLPQPAVSFGPTIISYRQA